MARRVFLAWGVVIAALVLVAIPFPPESRPAVTTADWLAWAGLFAACLVLMWLARGRRALIACETAAVLALVATRPALGLEGLLLVAVAFQLGGAWPARVALPWIVAQSAAMTAILAFRFVVEHALFFTVIYLPFQLLAWVTATALAHQADARDQLARINAELLATRELLAANSRSAERLRISRELHDVFGHRLAALGLHLEAATRVAPDERAAFVARAHDAVRALLQDVREVVANLRRGEPVDVGEVLRVMVREIPRPAIHVECPDAVPIGDPDAAHAVLRCAQEIVTNTIKHSGGEHLWIELRARGSGVELVASDDGRGASELREGHGLRGMRERLVGLGGSLEIETAAHAGFRVKLFVPGGAA